MAPASENTHHGEVVLLCPRQDWYSILCGDTLYVAKFKKDDNGLPSGPSIQVGTEVTFKVKEKGDKEAEENEEPLVVENALVAENVYVVAPLMSVSMLILCALAMV